MNFEKELIVYNGIGFPFAMLGLDSDSGSGYNMTYTIKDTYEDADGKFSTIFGDVVFVDCNYFIDQVIDKLYEEL